jgi:hypothetical protein
LGFDSFVYIAYFCGFDLCLKLVKKVFRKNLGFLGGFRIPVRWLAVADLPETSSIWRTHECVLECVRERENRVEREGVREERERKREKQQNSVQWGIYTPVAQRAPRGYSARRPPFFLLKLIFLAELGLGSNYYQHPPVFSLHPPSF